MMKNIRTILLLLLCLDLLLPVRRHEPLDFVTAVRSMRGGIIRVEEIDGIAYTLTTLSPENGGGFTVTGGSDTGVPVVDVPGAFLLPVYDLCGRMVNDVSLPGIYIKEGKKVLIAKL